MVSASDPNTVFSVVGEEGLRRLVSAFYRQVPTDEILGPMYPPHDLAGAERRLGDFLIYRFGGPPTYLQERGNPQLRMRHHPFSINQAARDRWVKLMDAALDETALPPDATATIRTFLQDVATFLINQT